MLKELLDLGDGNFRRFFFGEAEYPGRNAAKGNAAAVVFGRQLQTGFVAGSKKVTVLLRQRVVNDGPYGMQNILRGLAPSVILTRPVGSGAPVLPSFHGSTARLDAAVGVDTVVNAVMAGLPAASIRLLAALIWRRFSVW